MITKPLPFQEAIGFLLNKEDLPADWDASMWSKQEEDFQTKAFFSAKVENARFLDRAHGFIFDYLAKVRETVVKPDGTSVTALQIADRSHFVERMTKFMIAEGMVQPGEIATVNQKDVTDIRSRARLNLIFDTNVRQAYGFGQWKQGMTQAALRAFPAARLIRDRGVKEPRPRHQYNLGEVLLKTDRRWAEYHNARDIGGFGVPWGPYGFNSGVTQEDVSKSEARALGLNVDSVAPVPAKITDGTEASVRKMDPAIKAKLLAELRRGPRPLDAAEVARNAAADTRRIMLLRGLAKAEEKGDTGKIGKYQNAIAELSNAPQGLAVTDDGDKIILGDRLDDRPSKIRKRDGISEKSAKLALAEKIFDSIDQHAESPRKAVIPTKVADRSRQLFADKLTLTPDERKLLKSPLEILLIYDQDGKLKRLKMGDENKVKIPTETDGTAILSHNHPSGRGPSAQDLKASLENPGRTLRIVARNENGKIEIFRIKTLKNLGKEEIEDIAAEYQTACNQRGESHQGRRDSLALILEIYGDILEIVTAITR